MKLIGHTYDCNSLTNFAYEVNEMTGNGNCVNLLKHGWKRIREITWGKLTLRIIAMDSNDRNLG